MKRRIALLAVAAAPTAIALIAAAFVGFASGLLSSPGPYGSTATASAPNGAAGAATVYTPYSRLGPGRLHGQIHDIHPEFRNEIEHFFQIHKDLEDAKTETRGFGDASASSRRHAGEWRRQRTARRRPRATRPAIERLIGSCCPSSFAAGGLLRDWGEANPGLRI